MSPKRAVLDTNIVIALFAGDPGVTELIARQSAVYLPVPVLAELYRGAFGSFRRDENIQKLETFAEDIAVLPCDVFTARKYGELKHALAVKGRPIPENDLWIAAIAAQHSCSVMTRDSHFKDLPGIATLFVGP